MTEPTGYPYLDDRPGPLAFAHRGGPAHPDLVGLENTLTAFRHAVALGYDFLETDVHATRDGVLIAFHDTLLDRVTDSRGALAEATYDEVAPSRIGGREPIPTLAELFAEFPGARFNIDLKSESAVPLLARFIVEHDAHDRILVGSFSLRRLNRFRALTGGRVATSASPLEVMAFRFLPSGRLADRLTRGRVAALQIPHRRGRFTITTLGLVRRAHAAGKHVHSWTIDEPAEMIELLDRGVDGLMTDRTDILKDVLAARGQWKDQR
ncbi:MAG: glycerophosphodiester phosphodiesterase [Nocardioides sp.]